jgi:hypothetical protein
MPDTVKGDMMASVAHVTKERREITLRRAAMIGVNYLAGHKHVEEISHEELETDVDPLREAS